ncbi:segregation and condensation protein B [Nitrobacteraceae bacterium AZCC 1564]
MPSPARVHHFAPVEDIPMEETKAEVSVEETSIVERDVAQVEPEVVGAGEEATAEEVSSADEAVTAAEVSSAEEVVMAEEMASADQAVADSDSGDIAVADAVAPEETSSVHEAAASVGDEEATSVGETASVTETTSTDEVASVEAPAVAESVSVVDEAPAVDAAARPEELRLLEAMLFASTEPLDEPSLAKRMPEGVDIKAALARLQEDYSLRGVNLVRVANKWTFRTASDLSWLMTRESVETRRLSRAAIETLAIIAYHQPVTRAEIEEIRGVVTSKGTLDVLLETGWIRPRGRRKTPGRPLTFGTTEGFLSQFSLEALGDLPGLEELKGSGLLDTRLPTGFSVPSPSDDPALREDEDPLEPGDLDLGLAPAVEPEKDGES